MVKKSWSLTMSLRLQEHLRLRLPASGVWDGFHHGVSHRNQYRGHCRQGLTGAHVFNLKYCQSGSEA